MSQRENCFNISYEISISFCFIMLWYKGGSMNFEVYVQVPHKIFGISMRIKSHLLWSPLMVVGDSKQKSSHFNPIITLFMSRIPLKSIILFNVWRHVYDMHVKSPYKPSKEIILLIFLIWIYYYGDNCPRNKGGMDFMTVFGVIKGVKINNLK